MIRILCFFLVAALACRADNPGLEVKVVEGDGAIYPIGSRATRGVTVLVSDSAGRPVDGAIVSFSLPMEGPGGVFASGGRTELATTHADGRAAAWGMQWNRTPGTFEIRIAAVKGETRATVVSSQSLKPADKAAARSQARSGGGGSHKVLWIALAIAGAAAGGVAAAGLSKSSSSGSAPATGAAATSIGSPTIILGHP